MKKHFKDDKLLDQLNKKMKHLERVKKLRVEKARTRHKMSADMDACTRIFLESLLNMCDPFVKGRFSTYK